MCILQAILIEGGIAFDNNNVSLFFSLPRVLVLVRLERLGSYRGTAIQRHAASADVSPRLLSV
jgi:hypothetical protein